MYIYAYRYMYISPYIHTYTYLCIYTYIHLHTRICIFTFSEHSATFSPSESATKLCFTLSVRVSLSSWNNYQPISSLLNNSGLCVSANKLFTFLWTLFLQLLLYSYEQFWPSWLPRDDIAGPETKKLRQKMAQLLKYKRLKPWRIWSGYGIKNNQVIWSIE